MNGRNAAPLAVGVAIGSEFSCVLAVDAPKSSLMFLMKALVEIRSHNCTTAAGEAFLIGCSPVCQLCEIFDDGTKTAHFIFQIYNQLLKCQGSCQNKKAQVIHILLHKRKM
jgi:hypothetical protein